MTSKLKFQEDMMYMENISDTLTLYKGVKIPGLGICVWQISPLHKAK